MRRALPALLLIASATCSYAIGLGVRAGTTGVGGDIGFDVAPTFTGRVGFSAMNFNRTVDQTDASYDGKLKLSNLSLLLDFSPVGPFRLTGGFVAANNKIDITGTPKSGSYNLNGVNYSAASIGSVNGQIKAKNSFAPYLGVGYGDVSGGGINFYGDLGIIFQGGAKSSLNVVCGAAVTPAQCAQIQSDAAGETRKLDDKVKSFKYYPVANIGVTVGF